MSRNIVKRFILCNNYAYQINNPEPTPSSKPRWNKQRLMILEGEIRSQKLKDSQNNLKKGQKYKECSTKH